MNIEKIEFCTKTERVSSCRKSEIIFEGFIVTLKSEDGILMRASFPITFEEIVLRAEESYKLEEKYRGEYEDSCFTHKLKLV